MKKWLATAKPGNRGESLRALQEVSKERITNVADVVEGESVTAVTVGDWEGCEDMEHMMEDEEVEDREEDEESVGEEEEDNGSGMEEEEEEEQQDPL